MYHTTLSVSREIWTTAILRALHLGTVSIRHFFHETGGKRGKHSAMGPSIVRVFQGKKKSTMWSLLYCLEQIRMLDYSGLSATLFQIKPHCRRYSYIEEGWSARNTSLKRVLDTTSTYRRMKAIAAAMGLLLQLSESLQCITMTWELPSPTCFYLTYFKY